MGASSPSAYDSNERAVRDLPWSAFRTTVHIEVYRVKCPECGVKVEKVPLLPNKAPFSKRFEDRFAALSRNSWKRWIYGPFCEWAVSG